MMQPNESLLNLPCPKHTRNLSVNVNQNELLCTSSSSRHENTPTARNEEGPFSVNPHINMASSAKNQQQSILIGLSENDVPIGRTQEIRDFIGNIKYRELVDSFVPIYEEAKNDKHQKSIIANSIYRHITSNGGRFLEKARGETTWHQISKDKALVKINQALRMCERRGRPTSAARQKSAEEQTTTHHSTTQPSDTSCDIMGSTSQPVDQQYEHSTIEPNLFPPPLERLPTLHLQPTAPLLQAPGVQHGNSFIEPIPIGQRDLFFDASAWQQNLPPTFLEIARSQQLAQESMFEGQSETQAGGAFSPTNEPFNREG